jgi:mycothiol synthase
VTDYPPQLRMLRDNLHDLPALDIPAGYTLRHFREGDQPGLNAVMSDAFGGEMEFALYVMQNPGFMPQRTWVICQDETIVAVASMLYEPICDAANRDGAAFLHWVAGLKGHSGKKLGYWVCLAVMHRMVSEGYRLAGLGTDDDRLAAIKTYLNLGFIPRIATDCQRDRWRTILTDLGAPELIDTYADILNGPLHEY